MAQDAFALSAVDPAIGISVRSRRVWHIEIEGPLVAEGFAREAVGVVLKAMQNDLYGESEKAKKAAGGAIDLARNEIVVLGRPEILYLRQVAAGVLREAGGDAKAPRRRRPDGSKRRRGTCTRSRPGRASTPRCSAGSSRATATRGWTRRCTWRTHSA
jgi:hypothetical protein